MLVSIQTHGTSKPLFLGRNHLQQPNKLKSDIKTNHICSNHCSVKMTTYTGSRSVEMASELRRSAVSVVYIVFPRSPVGQCFCTTDSLSEIETCCDQLEHSALQQQLVFPKQHVSRTHTHIFSLTVTVIAVSRLPADSLILHYAGVRLRFRLVCSVWFVCASKRYLLKEHLSGMLENESWILSCA